jgi:hypothetical protein
MKKQLVQVFGIGAPYAFGGEIIAEGYATTNQGITQIVKNAVARLFPGQTSFVKVNGSRVICDEQGNWVKVK